VIRFAFRQDKAIEAILYVINEIEGLDGNWLSAILYKADKVHLVKYGRFIYGETYAAMRDTVVAMNMMGLIISTASPDDPQLPFKVRDRKLVALREANLDELSESDKDCLSEGIAIYFLGKEQLNPCCDNAWQKAKNKTSSMGKRICEIQVEDIVKNFKDADSILDYLKENSKLEAMWQ
jgi:hypothetical protein